MTEQCKHLLKIIMINLNHVMNININLFINLGICVSPLFFDMLGFNFNSSEFSVTIPLEISISIFSILWYHPLDFSWNKYTTITETLTITSIIVAVMITGATIWLLPLTTTENSEYITVGKTKRRTVKWTALTFPKLAPPDWSSVLKMLVFLSICS